MPFNNQSNASRVQRILEALEHIDTSARSNRASPDDLRLMLAPVFAKLGDLGLAATAARIAAPIAAPAAAAAPEAPEAPAGGEAPRKGQWGTTAPVWASVHDMAAQAPLEELTTAMAVLMDRLGQHFHDLRQGQQPGRR